MSDHMRCCVFHNTKSNENRSQSASWCDLAARLKWADELTRSVNGPLRIQPFSMFGLKALLIKLFRLIVLRYLNKLRKKQVHQCASAKNDDFFKHGNIFNTEALNTLYVFCSLFVFIHRSGGQHCRWHWAWRFVATWFAARRAWNDTINCSVRRPEPAIRCKCDSSEPARWHTPTTRTVCSQPNTCTRDL